MLKYTTLLAAGLALAACSGGDSAARGGQDGTAGGATLALNVELPEGVTQEMVTSGQRLFNQQTCFTCHGRDASGAPLAPALNDRNWINTDGSYDELVNVIRTGVPQPRQYPSPMPAMGGTRLSEDQVRSLAAYVYALSRS
jgi:mono/diheme cytochrome c family protein